MTALRKYTDRDVRDDREMLESLVRDYLDDYTGEFEFLIGMKQRLAVDYPLTTGMVRGVLNCMLTDPRIDGLPEPSGDVIEMRHYVDRATVTSREPAPPRPPCPMEGEGHYPHWYTHESDPVSRWHCIGGWWALTREISHTRARFHAPYVRGRNSNLVHRSIKDGSICWFPPFHEYGHAEPTFYWVGVACSLPALKDPDLLTEADIDKDDLDLGLTPRPDARGLAKYPRPTLCPRCFPR